jgi:hypothetical protein
LLSVVWGCSEDSDLGCPGNPARITGSGVIVALDRDFVGYSVLDIAYTFEVTVTQADSFSVKIRVDDNIVPYLDVGQEGNTLYLHLKPCVVYDDVTPEADVTMPDVVRISLSGASSAALSGFDFTHTLPLTASGASLISGTIRTGDMTLNLSGASNASLAGEGANLNANVSGASQLGFAGFECEDIALDVSGASQATVTFTGTLSGSVSGASVLNYYGNPSAVDVTISGESRIFDLD